MKIRHYILAKMTLMSGILFALTSCTNDLLDLTPSYLLDSEEFWQTEQDAEYALNGVYSAARDVFDREYLWDGQGDYIRIKTTSITNGYSRGYVGSRFDRIQATSSSLNYFKYLYALVNRANYVIYNVSKMIDNAPNESTKETLESIVGETRLLRGLGYFRLITMWGDVPYYTKVVKTDNDVNTLPRMPIEIIKDSILADISYAVEKLPNKAPVLGRVGKAAAYAFRGKVQLYWACWNKFGWDELSELKTFIPNADKALAAYAAAAADLKEIIDNQDLYGVALFRNGEPGDCDLLGKADILPNYYYMFIPSTGNGSPENIMVMTHGGAGSDQCEELMREFGTKSQESSNGNVQPRLRIVNYYQSTVTGDYCDPVIYKTNIPSGSDPNTYKNSALNPETFVNRDYRMKSSILWEYEVMACMNNLMSSGYKKYSYKNLTGKDVGGSGLDAINADADYSGVIMRKFVRNYAGQGQSEGDFNFPIMRLADVYLMYAEAINEANNGPDALSIELVNKIRHRGNLPPLGKAKISNKDNFFQAVEQERIVELFAEGHRAFDLRRWRKIGSVAGPAMGNGLTFFDTWGTVDDRMLRESDNLVYKQAYIFQIPTMEIERNPNLIQTPCWI